MHRRHLLTIAPAALLAGCGTLSQQQATQLQALLAGARSIDASISAAVPSIIAVVPGLTAAQKTALTNEVAALHQAVVGLTGITTITEGTTFVQAIETSLNVIVGVAASIPLIPEPYHAGLVIAALALPAVEQLVGLAVTEGTALAATIKAGKVTPAQPAAVSP